MLKKIVASILLCAFLNICVINNMCLAAAVQVKSGRQISVVLKEKETSKTVTPGEKIKGQIEYDVKIDGVKVFKAGDLAVLNVADVRKARCWGNPGEMLIVNGSVTDANGIAHRTEFYRKITGEEKSYPKVLGAISIFFLFPLALFGFVKGGQAELLPRLPIEVTLADDFTFVQKL